MNNLIVLLALLVACVGSTNGQLWCYYCANCPNPFTPDPRYVTVVASTTNFCAKKSYSSDPSAPNSRGAAEPGLCVVTGCRWIYDSTGKPMYTCCCSYPDYCNGSM